MTEALVIVRETSTGTLSLDRDQLATLLCIENDQHHNVGSTAAAQRCVQRASHLARADQLIEAYGGT